MKILQRYFDFIDKVIKKLKLKENSENLVIGILINYYLSC